MISPGSVDVVGQLTHQYCCNGWMQQALLASTVSGAGGSLGGLKQQSITMGSILAGLGNQSLVQSAIVIGDTFNGSANDHVILMLIFLML